MITKEIEIEELIEKVPEATKYLMQKGIQCVVCGEPIWGSLEETAKRKNFTDEEIDLFVEELNKFI